MRDFPSEVLAEVGRVKLPITVVGIDAMPDSDLYAVRVEFADGNGAAYFIPGFLVSPESVHVSAALSAVLWHMLDIRIRTRPLLPKRAVPRE
jgi:hypothetical protein